MKMTSDHNPYDPLYVGYDSSISDFKSHNLGMNIFSQVNTKVKQLEFNSNPFFLVPENWRSQQSMVHFLV